MSASRRKGCLMMEMDCPRSLRKASTSLRQVPSRVAFAVLIAACGTAVSAPVAEIGEVAGSRMLAPAPAAPAPDLVSVATSVATRQPGAVSTSPLLPPTGGQTTAGPTPAQPTAASTTAPGVKTGASNTGASTTARDDDPAAQTALALRYEHAEGVPKDLAKAHALYCKAAREGHLDAQFALGWMYANGRGVPRDDGIAAAFFEIAAEQGHPGALKLLKLFQRKPDTELPECMLPDPPVYTTIEHEVPLIAEDREADEPLAAPRNDIERLVYRIAPRYAVDPRLALAVITVESDFKPMAVSPKNAQGLMQLIPETATRFGVKRILNPVENINGGLAYLRWLLAFFKGDVTLVAAAYNAGERAVEKYRGVPPYAETRQYVKKITALYKKPAHPYVTGIVEPSDMLAKMRRPLR